MDTIIITEENPNTGHPIKILLVEDEALIALRTVSILQNHGYQVQTVNTAEKAVHIGCSDSVDLILMDIDLGRGKMDGTEAAVVILQKREVPIVFVTSHSEKEIVDRVKGITRYGYVVKSSGEFVLLEAITMAFELFEAHRNLEKENEDRRQVEKIVEETAAFYSHLMENSIDAVYLLDKVGAVLDVNSVACEMIGYSKDQLLHMTIDDIDLNYPSRQFIEFWDNSPEGTTRLFETVHQHSNGEIIPVEVNGIFFMLNGEKYLYGVARDIRERKKIVNALRESEDKYRRFYEYSPSLILEADADTFEILDCNPVMAERLGKTPAELIGKSIRDFLPPDIFESRVKAGNEALATGSIRTFRDENGGRYFMNTFIPIIGEDRRSVMTITIDITELMRTQSALEESRDRFIRFMEQLPGSMFIKDHEGRLLYCNSRFAATAGSTADELIGKKSEDYTSAEYRDKFNEENSAVLESGKPHEFEHSYMTGEGEKHWLTRKFPVEQPEGKPLLGMISFDITRRKELAEKNRFQAILLESVEQAVIATDLKGTVTHFNKYAEILYGWKREEAIGRDILELTVLETTHDQGMEIMKSLAAGKPWAGEFTARRKDGSTFWAYVKDSPITNDRGELTGIVGISHDISEQKNVDRNFRTLAENAGVGITVLQNDKIIYANSTAAKISGYSVEEMLSQTTHEMIDRIHPADRVRVAEIYSRQRMELRELSVQKAIFDPIEYRHVREDGTVVWTEAHTSAIEYNGGPALLVVHSDLTKGKALAEALRLNSERYKKAQELGKVGNWEYNIQTKEFWGSEQAKRIFGLDPDSAYFTTEAVEGCIPGREWVHQAMIDLIEQEKEYNIEYGIITYDAKKRKTLTSIAELERDHAGEPLKVMGVIQDITERKIIENDLESAITMKEEAVKAAQVGLWEWDLKTDKVNYSETWKKILGYNGDEIGDDFEEFTNRLHPDDKQRISDESGRCIEGRLQNYETEFRMRHKNGSYRWILGRGSIVRDGSGNPYKMRGSHLDVTDFKATEENLKQAVEQKNHLMQELNHRIKNNLLMVSSLVQLKNQSLGDIVDLSDLKHQIDAIRIVHEKLYQSDDPSKISIRNYILDLLPAVFSLSGREIVIENTVKDMHLSSKTAIPLGLIINEAATNAIKHGFTSGVEARFSVDFRKDGKSGYFILTISNTGRPFPETVGFENSETLGLRLIAALTGQLEGTIELQRDPHPVFTIRFPAE